MKGNRSPRGYWLLFPLVAAFIALTLISSPARAQSNSQVRIVRLSFVEGTVTVYRPDADQWAKAFVNTPIQQGFKVATDSNSFAEVEFENGSTVRLGQLSELDFNGLSLSPEGGRINRLNLTQGYASFAITPARGDVYKVRAAGSTFDVSGKTMFRLDLNEGSQRLEVFSGEVGVQSPSGNGTIARNQVLVLTPGGAEPFQVSEGITKDAWDRWVEKRQQTETVAVNKAGPDNGSLYAGSSMYGWNDLSYFGAWNYLPGYGSCWSPMMGSAWTPYSIGRWSWYQGFGYTWISGLPWGWLPFHYGSWVYPAGLGWCWMPGNFSAWSPALVTWYQGPGWVSWAPRTVPGRYDCPAGQNCSVAVSSNTFQGGRGILPGDVLRRRPFEGRVVASPTLPLTRSLRLPGPARDAPRFTSGAGATARSNVRIHRITTAPNRVFSRSSIRGAWDVQPHAPAVFNSQTRRFVNRTGPAINNDMLLRTRRGMRPRNKAGLTSLPFTGQRVRHFNSLAPSVIHAGTARMRSFRPRPMPDFRQERRMLKMQRRMERQQARRQMQMERQSRMMQRRMERSAAPRNSSGGFGRSQSQSMGRPSGGMGGGMRSSGMGGGGMRGGGSGGMGGGMRGGGGGPHGGGPHR